MRPDPLGHVRPGQPARISASAFNRMAAAVRPQGSAAELSGCQSSLPALTAVVDCSALEASLGRAVQWGEAIATTPHGVAGAAVPAVAPIPAPWDPTGAEAIVPALRRLRATPAHPGSGQRPRVDDPIAVCLDANLREFAVSGYAITRVRVHSPHHRWARHPVRREADSVSDWDAMRGVLDSAFSGPARIVGYVRAVPPLAPVLVEHDEVSPVYPAVQFVWALVRL